MKKIPYSRQWISEDDVKAVVEVLRSDWLTQGPVIERFEKAVGDYCNARNAVAVNSGTSALHISCLALGLGPGDLLWTSPNTFVASANCALYCGASVDFVDIDPQTYNISIDALATKLEVAERDGRLPKIVVPVHFAGQSCDMRAIHALGDRYGFRILEDASHAIGGQYLDRPIGSCAYSDITVVSFHPVKIITTGEGGMALTNDAALAERMARLRTHGITREPRTMRKPPEGAWYYEQIELGNNYRITDIQAALGCSQIGRIDSFVDRRRRLARRYASALADLPVTIPWQHADTRSAWHIYVIRLHLDRLQCSRREVFDHLRMAGIGVNVHYIPVHTQPYYLELGFNPGDFPEAERHYREAMSLPLFPTLSEQQQYFVVDTLREALS